MATILVFDTDKENLRLNTLQLMDAGYEVAVPSDVDFASRMVSREKGKPDMLLVDWELSAVSPIAGLVAASLENGVPVLIKTQHDEGEWRRQAMESVRSYIANPLPRPMEELLEVKLSVGGTLKCENIAKDVSEFLAAHSFSSTRIEAES
ncbi:MAG: hypothetical protein ACOYT9_03485 [Patescibacteria group bacterium]